MPITILNVAKHLSLSITTVSRALDGYPDVSEATRQRVLHAAHETRLEVGVDLAVAGFDGVQGSIYSQPPLTTADLPICEIAHQLVQKLLAEINDVALPERHIWIQPILRFRRSTQKGEQE